MTRRVPVRDLYRTRPRGPYLESAMRREEELLELGMHNAGVHDHSRLDVLLGWPALRIDLVLNEEGEWRERRRGAEWLKPISIPPSGGRNGLLAAC